MSDEIYTYDLRQEQPIVAALVRQASTRYAQRFGQRPVNAIEIGFWVEGARLVVRLISNPDYEFNWITYPTGYSEAVDRASYGEHTTIPSWELLNNLSGLADMQVRDGSGYGVPLHAIRDGYQEGWRDVVTAIGRNVMLAVFDSHADLFAGVSLTDPCEIAVYEDEDSDLVWRLRVSGGAIAFAPTEP